MISGLIEAGRRVQVSTDHNGSGRAPQHVRQTGGETYRLGLFIPVVGAREPTRETVDHLRRENVGLLRTGYLIPNSNIQSEDWNLSGRQIGAVINGIGLRERILR